MRWCIALLNSNTRLPGCCLQVRHVQDIVEFLAAPPKYRLEGCLRALVQVSAVGRDGWGLQKVVSVQGAPGRLGDYWQRPLSHTYLPREKVYCGRVHSPDRSKAPGQHVQSETSNEGLFK